MNKIRGFIPMGDGVHPPGLSSDDYYVVTSKVIVDRESEEKSPQEQRGQRYTKVIYSQQQPANPAAK